LSSAASLAIPHVSTSSDKRYALRKTLLGTQCVFPFSIKLLFKTFLILRKIQRNIVTSVKKSSSEVPFILN
jgi:hypothetical protein